MNEGASGGRSCSSTPRGSGTPVKHVGILGLGDPDSTDGVMPIKSMARPV